MTVTRSRGGVSVKFPNGDKMATMGATASIDYINRRFGPVMGKHIIGICDVVPPLPTPEEATPNVKPKNWVTTPVRCHPKARLTGPEGKRAHNRPLVPVIHAAKEEWKESKSMAERHEVKWNTYRPKMVKYTDADPVLPSMPHGG